MSIVQATSHSSSPVPPEQSPLRWRGCALLGFIVLVSMSLRLYRLDSTSLLPDEAWHLELSTGRGTAHEQLPFGFMENPPRLTSIAGGESIALIWTSLDRDMHPPLHYVILRVWRAIVGESGWAGRLLSVVQSTLVVVALFDVARILHGARAGLWAAAIAAVAPAQVILGQEIRGYPQLTLLGLIAAGAAARLWRFGPGWSRASILGGCVLGMMLTHHFAIGLSLALGIFVLLALRGAARRQAIVALAVAAVVYTATWGPFLVRQRGIVAEGSGTWLKDDSPGSTLRTLGRLADAPVRLLFEPMQKTYPAPYLGALILLILPAMLRRRPDLLLWCLWILGTLGFVAAMDLSRQTLHLQFPRHFSLAAPAVYAFLAAAVARRFFLVHLIPAVVVLSCIGSITTAYEAYHPDWRPLAKLLDEHPDDLLAFWNAGPDWKARAASNHWTEAYLCLSHYLQTPRPVVAISGSADAALLAEMRRYRRIWLICVATDPGNAVPGAVVRSSRKYPDAANLFELDWESPATAPSP